VIMIVNYNRTTFMVQATGREGLPETVEEHILDPNAGKQLP